MKYLNFQQSPAFNKGCLLQYLMIIQKGPSKFPLSLNRYEQVESEAGLMKLFQFDLEEMGLTINQNPFVVLPSQDLIPDSENKYLRVVCSRGQQCNAKLIYQFDSQRNLYQLTTFADNEHSHQIFLFKEIMKMQKKKQILSKRNEKNRKEEDDYVLGTLYQNDKMKKRYNKFGKLLYICIVEIKDYTILYFAGQNYMTDVIVFGLSLMPICSIQKFKELVSTFRLKNTKQPQTVISTNQQTLEILKTMYNSVCLYCFDDILPADMKIRAGVIKLLKQSFSPNQWEIHLRKVLIFVRNTRQSQYLKYIYDHYERLSLYNLPPTFLCFGFCVYLGQLLTQHTQQYWTRYRSELQQQKNLIQQANSQNTFTNRPIPSIKNMDQQHFDMFLKLTPKIIQTSLQEIEVKQVLAQLKSIQESNKTIINPNQIRHELYQYYSPYAIDFLIEQRNRAMFCDIFQVGKQRFLVKQPHEMDRVLMKSVLKIPQQQQGLQQTSIWVCTCQLIQKTGLPCSHILKLLISQKQRGGRLADYIDDFWILDKRDNALNDQSSKTDATKVKLQDQ